MSCKNGYEKVANASKKTMIFCKLRENEDGEMMKICVCQRFCNDKDRYIPYKQKEICKYYE